MCMHYTITATSQYATYQGQPLILVCAVVLRGRLDLGHHRVCFRKKKKFKELRGCVNAVCNGREKKTNQTPQASSWWPHGQPPTLASSATRPGTARNRPNQKNRQNVSKLLLSFSQNRYFFYYFKHLEPSQTSGSAALAWPRCLHAWDVCGTAHPHSAAGGK